MAGEKEIDLVFLFSKLWNRKGFILKAMTVGAVLGIIVAFSIPKEYTTSIILAPESSSSMGQGASVFASMTGFNIGAAGVGDVFSAPELYPEILNSTPFIMGLFDVHVKNDKDNIDKTLYAYIKDDQKSAWWNYIIGLPFKLINLFKGSDEGGSLMVSDGDASKVINLTKDQAGVLGAIKGRLNISVDKKTEIITLSIMMQSPEISASVADTVTFYLQSYITMYRTQKARQDLYFTEKLYNEAKNDYYEAQRQYAMFRDENINVTSAKYRTTEERLQNEFSLAYTAYNQMAQQLQMAKVKVQEVTPVYTIIQPSVTPLIASSPMKKYILAGFVLLSFVVASSIVLVKDPIKDMLVKLKKD